MATINQLTKQIETSQKRIKEYQAKQEMYLQRAEKALEKASKQMGVEITSENFCEIVNPRENWELYDRINNNLEFVTENQRNEAIETKQLAKLQSQLEILQNNQKAKEDILTPVEAQVATGLLPKKEIWKNNLLQLHRERYIYIHSHLPQVRQEIARLDKLVLGLYLTHRGWAKRCESRRTFLKKHFIMSDAAGYEFEGDYLAYVDEQLEKSWQYGVKTIAEKLLKMGFDTVNPLQFHYQNFMAGRNVIETTIVDNAGRTAYARVIWAAENSVLVAPHTRYIVTERKRTMH